ncbi:hypothetical protein Tco_0802302 [Tanacetum coccineum]|uniref:Uncharacterized protein n=1 Tax=Tanacetum coccineum TaxID=301880 RepID=A0ABQ4ZYG1_9ASTR
MTLGGFVSRLITMIFHVLTTRMTVDDDVAPQRNAIFTFNEILSCIIVMSSSSAATYTSVYTDSEPWRFQWVSDDELEAPDAEPEHAPLILEYVPEPEYPEYLAPSDEEAPIEDQPILVDALPTTLSPGYVANSDPEEDQEDDSKEDHADYPADGGDDDDDEEEEESFKDKEEGEEHLALADSTTLPVVDPVPLAEDTKAF